MDAIDLLSISFDKLIKSEWDPPEDPYDEYTHFELGLSRFLYYQNHNVIMKIGGSIERLELDPDILQIIFVLPDLIAKMADMKRVVITFGEAMIDIEFTPENDRVKCRLSHFGYSHSETNHELDREQVLEELNRFLCELLGMAVKQEYVTQEEADGFLAETRRTA